MLKLLPHWRKQEKQGEPRKYWEASRGVNLQYAHYRSSSANFSAGVEEILDTLKTTGSIFEEQPIECKGMLRSTYLRRAILTGS